MPNHLAYFDYTFDEPKPCTGVERVDGLQGALIVRPQGPDPLASLYDEERIIALDDWYHDLYGELTFATSRCAAIWLISDCS